MLPHKYYNRLWFRRHPKLHWLLPYLDKLFGLKRHNCPFAPGSDSPFKPGFKNPVLWEPRGESGDLCCEYCGSMHPGQFQKLLEVWPEGTRIDLNSRRDKVYISRYGVKNADDGAIKFKLAHSPMLEDGRTFTPDFAAILNQRLQESKTAWDEALAKARGTGHSDWSGKEGA